MDREHQVNTVLRLSVLATSVLTVVLFLADVSLQLTLSVGAIAVILLILQFVRSPSMYRSLAREWIGEFERNKRIFINRIFDTLNIKGVEIVSEKGFVWVEEREGISELDMIRARARFSSDPRLVEAILCRIVTRIRNRDESGLVQDLKIFSSRGSEYLREYLRDELEEIPALVPNRAFTFFAEVEDTEVLLVVIANQYVSSSNEGGKGRLIYPAGRQIFSGLHTREKILDKLAEVYKEFSREELDQMFVNWEAFSGLYSRDEVLDQLVAIYEGFSREELDQMLVIEGNFPTPEKYTSA